jgi:hypothetical protein
MPHDWHRTINVFDAETWCGITNLNRDSCGNACVFRSCTGRCEGTQITVVRVMSYAAGTVVTQSEERPEQVLMEELAGLECHQAAKVQPRNQTLKV